MPDPNQIVNAVALKLRANTGVKAIVSTRIHKAVPVRPAYPCVSVFIPRDEPWDMKDVRGAESTVQVDCWTRDDRDQDTARAIMKAVKAALHEIALSLTSENHVLTREILSTVMADLDAVTVHGVQQFRVLSHA